MERKGAHTSDFSIMLSKQADQGVLNLLQHSLFPLIEWPKVRSCFEVNGLLESSGALFDVEKAPKTPFPKMIDITCSKAFSICIGKLVSTNIPK